MVDQGKVCVLKNSMETPVFESVTKYHPNYNFTNVEVDSLTDSFSEEVCTGVANYGAPVGFYHPNLSAEPIDVPVLSKERIDISYKDYNKTVDGLPFGSSKKHIVTVVLYVEVAENE